MEAADFRELHNVSRSGKLDRSEVGCVLVEREVSTGLMVIGEVAAQDAAQVSLSEDEYVIQTLASDRPDQALSERVLPRAVWRRDDFADPHALHAMPKWLTVHAVAVVEEVGRRGLVREGVHELLGGPVGCGVLGHVEVDHPSAVVSERDEHEEDAEASGGHGKEVDRDQVEDVVGEKRPPGLSGVRAALRHEPGDGALGNLNAKLQELSVDARGAPERIRGGHLPDQGSDLGVEGRAPSGWTARDPGPILAEAAALSAQDGVGRDDDQRLSPAGPDSGQANPEQTIHRVEPRPGRRSLVDGELLAQGQVLDDELAMAADEEGEEPKQVEEEGDHRAGIVSGSELTDQPLACRTEFWRSTAVLEWTGGGTWRGEFAGSPANGRSFSLQGCGFFRVIGGKIKFQRGYWDKATWFGQLGIPLEI